MVRYIKKIEWCAARHLHLATPSPDNLSVFCTDYMPYKTLPIVGLASIEVSDKVDNGCRKWTSKLSCLLQVRPSVPQEPMSFRLTAVDGTQFIMGLSDRPHPIVNIHDACADRPGGQCDCTLTATLNGPIPMLKLEQTEQLADLMMGGF